VRNTAARSVQALDELMSTIRTARCEVGAVRFRKHKGPRRSRRSVELLLRRQQEVLVERVGRPRDLDPFAASGDDRIPAFSPRSCNFPAPVRRVCASGHERVHTVSQCIYTVAPLVKSSQAAQRAGPPTGPRTPALRLQDMARGATNRRLFLLGAEAASILRVRP
jgi:hypothetical protein